MELVVYDDLLWKFIHNSYYFKKNEIAANPLASKVQLSLDVKCAPNYTEKLKLMGISYNYLMYKWKNHSIFA